MGCTYTHMFQCPGISCLSVHPGTLSGHLWTFVVKTRKSSVSYFEFGFAVGDGSPLTSSMCLFRGSFSSYVLLGCQGEV